ncbi:MAG: UDP-3-O-(3-hydroxymyristoyl) N-acetylglucosamine deacetylase [candidate division BRC1 bacterium ADurb.BinA364]|nr:MAG: UDP-3-O-(3-hydroxymyristoyl) N-acetylglucosamine deacetylase [candidate division BRC1 bacterium ADurb.BinA364]
MTEPPRFQRTLARPCEFEPGAGLRSGGRIRLRALPAPPDSGIRFRRIDLPGAPEIPALLRSIDAAALDLRTALACGEARVELVEHALAACLALALDNVVFELDGPELPIYDGSAAPYAEALAAAGANEQRSPRRFLRLSRPVAWCQGGVELVALPSGELHAAFLGEFPTPSIGRQEAAHAIDAKGFRRELAPARTFCSLSEAAALARMGEIRGAGDIAAVLDGQGQIAEEAFRRAAGDVACALIFGEAGPVNGALRFANEPARHKLVDLLGDACLLGRPLLARIIAVKSGHRSHAAFFRKILEEESRS